MTITYPDAFLEVRVSELAPPCPQTTLCAGYEGSEWRTEALADHLFQWLPYAALKQEDQLAFSSHNFVEMLKTAAAHIYTTRKTDSRGEIGELLLHLASILHFKTFPVVCKLILKSASNDTVKGFDGVHIVSDTAGFEIWLGESKFYKKGRDAIKDAVSSIRKHVLPSFLTAEKAMIIGHIGPDVPHRDAVVTLFKSQTSADKLLQMAVFPVLVAYESPSVTAFNKLSAEYTASLAEEVRLLRLEFASLASDITIRFQLIFVPLHTKELLVESFDSRLRPFL